MLWNGTRQRGLWPNKSRTCWSDDVSSSVCWIHCEPLDIPFFMQQQRYRNWPRKRSFPRFSSMEPEHSGHCRPHEDVGNVCRCPKGPKRQAEGAVSGLAALNALFDYLRHKGELVVVENAAAFNHLSTLHSKKAATRGSFRRGVLTVSTCDVRSTSTMTPCWMSIGLAALVMAYSHSYSPR